MTIHSFEAPGGTSFGFQSGGAGDVVIAREGASLSFPASDLLAFVAHLSGKWQEARAARVDESATAEEIQAAEEWRNLRRRLDGE